MIFFFTGIPKEFFVLSVPNENGDVIAGKYLYYDQHNGKPSYKHVDKERVHKYFFSLYSHALYWF